MKVLMIAPEPFFEPRGTPISVYQRLQALAGLGFQVDLLTYHLGQDVGIPGLTIYRVPNIPFIKHVRIGPSWSKAFLDVLLLCQAVFLLALRKYDVIHSHEEAAFFSALLSKVFRTSHLYDMHSSLPLQLGNFNFGNYWPVVRLFELLESWVIKTCDAVITIGGDLGERASSINPEIKLLTIDNLAVHTFDVASTSSSVPAPKENHSLNGKLAIVYTGTFERYQGLHMLLESAEIVKEFHPQVSFILVGGNPRQLGLLRDVVRKRSLDNCIHFVGAVPPAEALAYLEMAEILVSPRIEGTSVPLKIYSYLHAGKPIVATDLPAHRQVLNDEIALLVKPTGEALADGILQLIRAPDLRQQLGHQAQRFAKERLDPEDYAAKIAQVYQALKPSTSIVQDTPPLSHPTQAASQKKSAASPSLNPKS
jgi:glycosyltransferase involved in cell wall biosynthesis